MVEEELVEVFYVPAVQFNETGSLAYQALDVVIRVAP